VPALIRQAIMAYHPLQLALLLMMGFTLTATGCNRSTCIGLHPPSSDRNAPVIMDIELLPQSIQNPWTMLMALDFKDKDGDLGAGNVLIYVGASGPVQLPLAEYFATSELPMDAASGRIGLPLSLGQGAVSDDNVLRLGFQFVDAREHYSNCYAIDLHFEVTLPSPEEAAVPNTVLAPLRAVRVPCP
jgi:hypothetical protein